ncbi:unnamed protein product [Chondrus crispus]|uniref:Uncharacterized protein n=1 Tax=Chondrus crispus TaxID=2769 RepID=R7QAU3_CHOCR|nr:unnamed protein product [Chondrus crispus]CDF35194.1 unnamed protein product [Chondrus crispus]|eukprot:XP_005715013.1 unnamed protein product [Chondrus crispus]
MGGISDTAVNKDDLIALSCVCYVCTYGFHDSLHAISSDT